MADFELREFCADDIYPITNIIMKIGIDDLKTILTPERMKSVLDLVKKDEGKEETEQEEKKKGLDIDMTMVFGANIVIEVAGVILKNLPSCKKDIHSFLASLSGMTVQEVGKLPLGKFTRMIVAVIKKEEFKDFFSAVAELLE